MKVLLFSCLLLAALQYGQTSSVPNHKVTQNGRSELSLKVNPAACVSVVLQDVLHKSSEIVSGCLKEAQHVPAGLRFLSVPLCVLFGVNQELSMVLTFAPECGGELDPSHLRAQLPKMSLKLNPVACGIVVVEEVLANLSEVLPACIESAKQIPSGILTIPLCVAVGSAKKAASIIGHAAECH